MESLESNTIQLEGAPRSGLAAGVVVFRPDAPALLDLVRAVEVSVSRVILFLNSTIDPDLRRNLGAIPNVSLIGPETNFGIGAALNAIMAAADEQKHAAVILFDQDSRPELGTAAKLVATHKALVEHGIKPAVVAPRLVAEASARSKAPTYRRKIGLPAIGSAEPIEFVPTSGSLISIADWRAVGPFRADYFIDGIDVEWSFRAWAKGFSCWIVSDCPMRHSVGSGVIRLPIPGRLMPRQRPFRMYCLVRNSLYSLRLHHIPLAWKLAVIAYTPLQILAYAAHHRFNPGVLRLLAAGVADGLSGRLGIPRDAPERASPEPGGGLTQPPL